MVYVQAADRTVDILIIFSQRIHKFSFFKVSYLLLAVLGLHSCTGFSLVVASRDYSLVAMPGIFVAVSSLVAEHGLQQAQVS